MKLHLDKDAFGVLLEDIHSRTGYRTDVLEKDYYVVLILSELAEMQKDGLPAYFKGGTALYKALKTTNRFSEDIDLSVDTRNCSRSQSVKRLERATKKYASLLRDPEQGRTNRSEVISVYTYDPATAYDSNDALQRFGKLKIEATSFTISEPVDTLEVSAMLYDLATEEQRRILETVYEVSPFNIQTITMERIFVDKLFAAEAYVRKSSVEHRAFEAAKHIYDLAVLSHNPKIELLMADPAQMEHLLDIRLEEEVGRLDGIPGVAPSEFTFFRSAKDNADVQRAYVARGFGHICTTIDPGWNGAVLIALSNPTSKPIRIEVGINGKKSYPLATITFHYLSREVFAKAEHESMRLDLLKTNAYFNKKGFRSTLRKLLSRKRRLYTDAFFDYIDAHKDVLNSADGWNCFLDEFSRFTGEHSKTFVKRDSWIKSVYRWFETYRVAIGVCIGIIST